MYGAMREHAPQSTRLAGAITAATMTLAFGYAMANGMGAYIAAARCPTRSSTSPLPDTPTSIRLQRRQLTCPSRRRARYRLATDNLDRFTYDPDTITGETRLDAPGDTGSDDLPFHRNHRR